MGRKNIFFFCQQVAEFTEILRRQTLPVHLAGCVRQLMSFVDHQSPVIIEKGPHFLQTVGGVGQQIVVVANLDENFRASGFLQVLMVPADVSQRAGFLANLGDAHLPPVKPAEAGYGV